MTHKRRFKIKSWHVSAEAFQKLSLHLKFKFPTCYGSVLRPHTHLQLTCSSFFHGGHSKLLSVPQTHQAPSSPHPFTLTVPGATAPAPTGTLPPASILSGHLDPSGLGGDGTSSQRPFLLSTPHHFPYFFLSQVYHTPYLSFLLQLLH